MSSDENTNSPLINLRKYAERIGVSRQAVHYQITKGICAVPPVKDTKPPKWRLDDVDDYLNRIGTDK